MVVSKLKDFYDRSVYVWRVSRQPTAKEIRENLKIVIVGILIMGVTGFAISILFNLIEGKALL